MMSKRFFTTTITRSLKDSSKAAANLVDNTQSITTTGNSFKTFAEYRKSAIQHGPLKKQVVNNSIITPILTEYKDYGVDSSFAKSARSFDYRE